MYFIERLLELAQAHVVNPLNDLVETLDGVRTEINEFREKQSGFNHYEKKGECWTLLNAVEVL